MRAFSNLAEMARAHFILYIYCFFFLITNNQYLTIFFINKFFILFYNSFLRYVSSLKNI